MATIQDVAKAAGVAPSTVSRYLNGQLKLDEMISARLRLPQVNDALEALRQGTVARSVLVFD